MIWTNLPTAALVGSIFLAAAIVFVSGLRMTNIADRLADRTGMGEAIVGGVLLGAAMSLSGIIVSVTAALDVRPSLAVSNAVGGIAAQTVFLAVADMFYRRIKLEHAAADLANVLFGLILMVLLTLPFLAMTSPELTIWAVHPIVGNSARLCGRLVSKPCRSRRADLETGRNGRYLRGDDRRGGRSR